MPTGYTAAVSDGKITEFREFALQCSRAFGALIMMRDDSMDAPIPNEFEPSTYNKERLDEARALLDEVAKLTDEQCDERAAVEFDERMASHLEYIGSKVKSAERYRAMIAKVEPWSPPTNDHDRLKKFMLDQLNESLQFDCSPPTTEAPVRLTGTAWRIATFEKASKNIAYHSEAYAGELRRTAERNAWVKALRESLSPAPRQQAEGG